MLKMIAGIVVIVLAAGGWFYLDYLNKQEQLAALELRQTVEKNRAIAVAAEQARVASKVALEAKLSIELKTCLDAAQQASTDYLTANQKNTPRKAQPLVIEPTVIDTAAQNLANAQSVCQQQFAQHSTAGI